MPKKRNGSEKQMLTMPKGFRFPKAIKEIMVERLCYERYSLTLDWYLRKEREIFDRIMDVLIPTDKLHALEAHMLDMPLQPTMGSVSSIRIGLPYDDDKIRYSSIEHHHIGTSHALPSKISNNMWSWRYNENPNKKLMWPVEIERDQYRMSRDYPEPSGTLNVRMPLLPMKLRREVADYMRRRVQFHKEYDNFREIAQRSLMPLRSAKQVKEMNEKVYDVLVVVANEYKPPCSDVTVADDNAQLQNLM